MQTLYIDSLVLLNFSINFLILLATATDRSALLMAAAGAAATRGAGYAVRSVLAFCSKPGLSVVVGFC